MPTTQTAAAGALYYPYIHVRNANWLRANLLVFPHVERMIPLSFTPFDDSAIRPFTQHRPGKEPYLRPATIYSSRTSAAQESLAKRLARDLESPNFLHRFGKAATLAAKTKNDPGFQIHIGKLASPLVSLLRSHPELAWKPRMRDGEGYLEMHPHVGEVVMSTLAVACAQGDGLHVVCDPRSDGLHASLLTNNIKGVYDEWLRERPLPPPPAARAEDLFEFVIGVPGSLSSITPKSLDALTEDRQAIDDLLTTLRAAAKKIPAMDPGSRRDDYFKDAAAKLLSDWENDRRNMGSFWRRFFGRKAGDLGVEFGKSIAEKSADAMKSTREGAAASLGAATVAVNSGWIGSLASVGLFSAGAGLMIGAMAHGIRTHYAVRQHRATSRYRYLTRLSKAGVVFRSGANGLAITVRS